MSSHFANFTLGETLGQGGYGVVYECLQDDGSICAVKVVPKRTGDDPRAKEAEQEIEMEVQVMKRLKHPNIVQYLGVHHDEKSLYIFLELVPGGSIASMLGKYGKFREPIVRGYTREILQGIAYLHSNKILHRDIKSGNILVDTHGTCKVADFGCSKDLFGDVVSTAMTLKGTPQFMAPEVLRNSGKAGKGYTEKADVWSMGCTVVEMATGERPFPQFCDNETVMFHVAMHSHARPATPDWLSADCADFLDKCFARSADARPTVQELLQHPMVKDARLKKEQRLGEAADLAQIAMDFSDAGNAGAPTAKMEPREALATAAMYEEEDPNDESQSSDSGGSLSPPSTRQHSSVGQVVRGRSGAATMRRDISDGLSAAGEDKGDTASLREDVQGALNLIESAHRYVQTVTSHREKCFRLAQRMRRARIPLERVLVQGTDVDDELRNRVMDLRDELENSLECLRKHGTSSRMNKLWQWAFRSSINADFSERDGRVSQLTAGLDQHVGVVSDRSTSAEPDMWSKRVHKGKGLKTRCLSIVEGQIWCGSNIIQVFDAGQQRMVHTINTKSKVVKCIVQIGNDGSSAAASSLQSTRSGQVWTGHSDGRICVWAVKKERRFQLEREFHLDQAAQQAVLCMAQIAGKVWVGTSLGTLWVCDVGESAGARLAGECGGPVKSLLQVGSDVWSGSDGGEVCVWSAEHASRTGELHCGAGSVRAMIRLPDGKVLTGHQNGVVQVWTAGGGRTARAKTSSGVCTAVGGGYYVFTGHSDGRFRIWSISNERVDLFRAVRAHRTAVCAMVKDAANVWSASSNGTLRQWSIELLLTEGGAGQEAGVTVSNLAEGALTHGIKPSQGKQHAGGAAAEASTGRRASGGVSLRQACSSLLSMFRSKSYNTINASRKSASQRPASVDYTSVRKRDEVFGSSIHGPSVHGSSDQMHGSGHCDASEQNNHAEAAGPRLAVSTKLESVKGDDDSQARGTPKRPSRLPPAPPSGNSVRSKEESNDHSDSGPKHAGRGGEEVKLISAGHSNTSPRGSKGDHVDGHTQKESPLKPNRSPPSPPPRRLSSTGTPISPVNIHKDQSSLVPTITASPVDDAADADSDDTTHEHKAPWLQEEGTGEQGTSGADPEARKTAERPKARPPPLPAAEVRDSSQAECHSAWAEANNYKREAQGRGSKDGKQDGVERANEREAQNEKSDVHELPAGGPQRKLSPFASALAVHAHSRASAYLGSSNNDDDDAAQAQTTPRSNSDGNEQAVTSPGCVHLALTSSSNVAPSTSEEEGATRRRRIRAAAPGAVLRTPTRPDKPLPALPSKRVLGTRQASEPGVPFKEDFSNLTYREAGSYFRSGKLVYDEADPDEDAGKCLDNSLC